MKLFLFLMLFAFSAQAQTTDISVNIADIVARYAPSALPRLASTSQQITAAHQVTSSKSQFCVQNNLDQCAVLGYTETSCPFGGIACPFDKTKLNCTSLSCEDLGLFSTNPANMQCEAITNSGLTCYKCRCSAGFINPEGCGGLIDSLTSDKSICAELGYTNSITECNSYIPCPSNSNKVRCLDVVGCKETDCLAKYEVPENAKGTPGSVSCSCGGTKEVIVGWECDPGYSKEGNSCAEINCPEGQSESADALECSTGIMSNSVVFEHTSSEYEQVCPKSAAYCTPNGFKKANAFNTGKKQCYSCECHVNIEKYNWTSADAGEYGKLEVVACDGVHYDECKPDCPTDVIQNFDKEKVREKYPGVEPEHTSCSACGKTSQYMSGWHCNQLEGWQINAGGTACNPISCETHNKNGLYYSLDYKSVNDCFESRRGAGWNYVAQPKEDSQDVKSGGQWCGLCQCPYGEDDVIYHWTTSEDETSNLSEAEYSELGCNGKYKECTPKNHDYLSELPEHATEYSTLKICGQLYYKVSRCEAGYKLSNNDTECLPQDCTGYNIETEPTDEQRQFGEYRSCPTGDQIKYKLVSCKDDNKMETGMQQAIHYVMNSDQTACCRYTCDPYDTSFFVGETCPEGRTELERKQNGCGDTCIKCI
ncbi:MAG TPA: hypothetical protein DIC64_00890 [Alphaproteobacteria bacterium]|nr:hypothetical protein [Alphaproteobacteria bacterium]